MRSNTSNYPHPAPRQKSGGCTWTWLLAGCLALFLCAACFGVVSISGGILLGQQVAGSIGATQTAEAIALATILAPSPTATPTIPPTSTVLPTPPPVTPAAGSPTPTETPKPGAVFNLNPPPEIEQEPSQENASEHLAALVMAAYPAHDYYESAVRLGAVDDIERTITGDPYVAGNRRAFTVGQDEIEAELLVVTEHTYFWFELGLNANQATAAEAAEQFETEYYPLLVGLFGEEWRPGVDNDPHFSILHLDGLADGGELGFFDSGDEYPQAINNASNEQELIYLNMDNLRLGEELYFGTLVHEVQHLIQWRNDSNETAWLNEGLSQLAELYAGLDTVDTVYDYLSNPNTQLNTWEYDDEDAVFAHYGAAYLFSVYIWEQLGDEAIRELARHPGDGLYGVNDLLARYQPQLTLEQFIANWTVANYLDDQAAGPIYHYQNLDLSRPAHAIEVKVPPFSTVNQVNQFGVHYAELEMRGETTISFAGDTRSELITAPPPSGQQMWLAPGLDNLDAQLTAAFDLRGVNRATLEFWAWYDLEEDFDFAYVSVSTNRGVTWRLLTPDHASPGAYGPAFSGDSQEQFGNKDGWVREVISLNSYIGQEILVRFEVLTDGGITGRGFALDDITIAELSYATDVESGSDGWQADGFVQAGWLLPQQWGLHLIQFGAPPQVTPLPLNELNQGQWHVTLGPGGGVLVITPLTPFTVDPASYWLVVESG
ncbi:MAG: immune inhibitor A [Chloroflexi bacterium]|nr:immune inhibitor A [Chloroflexota bacterium]MCI0644548.1 immune inhibitor A [Chloroflexota bacterium]MCI0728763.1 immune inhibitor A [Chloroflexota bacterium]